VPSEYALQKAVSMSAMARSSLWPSPLPLSALLSYTTMLLACDGSSPDQGLYPTDGAGVPRTRTYAPLLGGQHVASCGAQWGNATWGPLVDSHNVLTNLVACTTSLCNKPSAASSPALKAAVGSGVLFSAVVAALV